MFQSEKTSLKQDIALVLAAAAAGFKLSDSKAVDTHDGACWRATLVHNRTKIVTVSNGGYGGPEESQYHATTVAGKAADKISLEKLFAVPEVAAAVRGNLRFILDLDNEYELVSKADYLTAKANIEASIPVPTAESVEFLVDHLAQATKFVAKMKRLMKTSLVFVFEGDDEKGAYASCATADTPSNRDRVRKNQKRPIDYFMADVFAVTNPASDTQ